MACRDTHALYQGASAWQDHHSAILPDWWADCRHLHQELFKKEVHLPLFTIGGEFIKVIQTTFSVHLEGGFFSPGFPYFPHFVCFLALFSVSALYRVTYGLSFRGPRIFMHLCFLTLPEYRLRRGVGDIYHHTHSFGQIGLVKPLS